MRVMIGPVVALGGSLLGSWTTIPKTADESRNTTTTLADDALLNFACAAGAKYTVRLKAHIKTANATMDYKWAQNYTGTLTEAYQSNRVLAAGVAAGTDNMTVAVSNALQTSYPVTAATSGIALVEMDIVLVTSTAGTFSFQWAQNTSDAGALIVQAGSYLEYMRVA